MFVQFSEKGEHVFSGGSTEPPLVVLKSISGSLVVECKYKNQVVVTNEYKNCII